MNFETKKTTDRRCEFWLQFENGTKMFAEMLDPVAAQSELIPLAGELAREATMLRDFSAVSQKKEVVINADDHVRSEVISRNDNRSSTENKSILKSALGKREEEKENAVTFENVDQESMLSKNEPKASSVPKKYDPKDDLKDYVKDKGASLTFTYKQGLVVQILPNGAVQQTIPLNGENQKKQAVI